MLRQIGLHTAQETAALCVFVPKEFEAANGRPANFIRVPHPQWAFAQVSGVKLSDVGCSPPEVITRVPVSATARKAGVIETRSVGSLAPGRRLSIGSLCQGIAERCRRAGSRILRD